MDYKYVLCRLRYNPVLSMSNVTQVSITRTEGEWDLILKKLCPAGDDPMKSLSKHIRREVLKIKTRVDTVPESVTWMGGPSKVKRPWIDKTIMADIQRIALCMKVPEATVIDRLIITPLLQPQP